MFENGQEIVLANQMQLERLIPIGESMLKNVLINSRKLTS